MRGMSEHSDPPAFDDPAGTWNRRCSEPGYLFGPERNAWLHEHAPALWQAGQRVLCVADGEGRNSVWLAQQGLTVDAFDISEVAVRKARDFARITGVKVNLAVADIAHLQWPRGLYDGVVAIFIQFASPQLRGRLFEGMKRALKPGGLLLLEGYRPEQIAYGTGGPRVPEQLYTEALLRQALADMRILELASYDAEVDEGPGHSGMSALIDLVAVKAG